MLSFVNILTFFNNPKHGFVNFVGGRVWIQPIILFKLEKGIKVLVSFFSKSFIYGIVDY